MVGSMGLCGCPTLNFVRTALWGPTSHGEGEGSKDLDGTHLCVRFLVCLIILTP